VLERPRMGPGLGVDGIGVAMQGGGVAQGFLELGGERLGRRGGAGGDLAGSLEQVAVGHDVPDQPAVPGRDAVQDLTEKHHGGDQLLAAKLKETLRDTAALHRHPEAVERELGPQVWSIEQPFFAERLAAMKKKISKS